MAAFVGRAEAARILGVPEYQVVALSRAGHLGQVRRGPGGGFVWDRAAVLACARDARGWHQPPATLGVNNASTWTA